MMCGYVCFWKILDVLGRIDEKENKGRIERDSILLLE